MSEPFATFHESVAVWHDAAMEEVDEDTEETNLQLFIRVLYEAYGASQAVDYFDLRSEDPASVKKWDLLLESQRDAFRRLHEVCRRVPVEDLMD